MTDLVWKESLKEHSSTKLKTLYYWLQPVTASETDWIVLPSGGFCLIVILEGIRDENGNWAEWIG